MLKRFLGLGLFLGLVGLAMFGCGGGTSTVSQSTTMTPTSGSVTVFGGDAPLCDVVSFNVTITGATLTPQGGGTAVSVISSPTTVDFAALMDFSTVLNFTTVPAGTYSRVTLTLGSAQLIVLQFTGGKLVPTPMTATLSPATVTVDIDPPLVVPANGSAGIELDFNLRKSVLTDSNGQVTGQVNPVFRAKSKTPTSEKGLGDLDDLKGMVQSVSTTPSGSFIGSFVLKTGSGQSFTIQVTSKTEFEGILGLTGLQPNTFVEVDAFVDSNHNIVAKEVEVEEKEEQEKAAFVGLISSVTRNSSGSVTQFVLFVREEHPDESACVQPKTLLTVNVTSSTEFKVTAKGANRASLTFDSTALGLGQAVVVHGRCQAGTPPTLNAIAIFLRLQTILGNFLPPPSPGLRVVGSDGKTGGFTFIPCGVVFQGSGPITVFTFKETAFAEVSDLNALTAAPTLAVKGLLFYEKGSITVNGITVTGTPAAPVPVVEAQQVHQLER